MLFITRRDHQIKTSCDVSCTALKIKAKQTEKERGRRQFGRNRGSVGRWAESDWACAVAASCTEITMDTMERVHKGNREEKEGRSPVDLNKRDPYSDAAQDAPVAST